MLYSQIRYEEIFTYTKMKNKGKIGIPKAVVMDMEIIVSTIEPTTEITTEIIKSLIKNFRLSSISEPKVGFGSKVT